MKTERVLLYDTTLRDGAQGDGITFSDAGKVRFVKMLDDIGVDFIEAGFPGSNPGDDNFFAKARTLKLKRAQLVAFGNTCRKGVAAADDAGLAALLAAGTPCCAICGKASFHHVRKVLRTSASENLRMVSESISHVAKAGKHVFFDAEQFFDGWRRNPQYALSVIVAARDAGAEAIVLCDTNGGSLPEEIAAGVAAARAALGSGVRIGVHTHNDAGLAVANSLAAVQAGARLVEGCVNGYGERTGNANWITAVPTLTFKLGYRCLASGKLGNLRNLSVAADDLVNRRPNPQAPYVGRDAFCHKAGTHADAVTKDPTTFEHIDPALVGNERRFAISALAGSAAVRRKVSECGFGGAGLDADATRELLRTIKRRESLGYTYDAADGSFKILAAKASGRHVPAFELEGFRVIVEKRGMNEPCLSEATVKVKVGGETRLTVDEGEGPVDALDKALKKALVAFYPEIRATQMSDFRVHIIDPSKALTGKTRVLFETTDGKRQWSTVGVSENIIEASWQALADGIECKLLSRAKKRSTKKDKEKRHGA